MRAIRISLFTLILGSILFSSCKKQTEEFETSQVTEYLLLEKNKYIIYRLDSTVFTNFNQNIDVHSYDEKHVIDAQIPDGLGRPSYRVFRYLRDTLGTTPWQNAGSYMITPLQNSLEVIENNMRYVKLALPLKEETTWKGNRFLPSRPYKAFYNFNNDIDMDTWDFTITSTGETVQLKGKTINDVLTVEGINDSLNVPVTDPAGLGSQSYFKEMYAKNIGLVFHELILWEYQPNSTGSGNYYGFGVKRTMIDHN